MWPYLLRQVLIVIKNNPVFKTVSPPKKPTTKKQPIKCKAKFKTRAAKINLELANFVNPWMRGTVFKIS